MKRIFIIFVILVCQSLAIDNPAKADRRGFINTVVIDPGHGGRDPGAVGRHSREKDITLAIALRLGQYINEYLPDVKVIYTRETDEFVELFRRAQIANQNQADLFISIHCNSSRNSSAYGTETFVMGLHRSEANLEVARKENASILFEEDYLDTYDGFDPHSPEANIIFSLYQNAYLEQSLAMASFTQTQFRERARRVDRGVKQAGFLVLYQITMPGILVEAGFLSNPREEQYLMSETGQAHIASAIFRAFREYKQEQDALAAARKQHLLAESNAGYAVGETTANPTSDAVRSIASQSDSSNPAGPVVSQPAPGNHDISQSSQPAPGNHDISQSSQPDPGDPTGYVGHAISFRVQIGVSHHKRSLNEPEFSQLDNPAVYFHEGLYKYTVGNAHTLEEAVELQAKMQKAGYKDAFVVAFHRDQRISPAEAIRLVQQQTNR